MTDTLKERAMALGLHGLLAHWSEISKCDWLPPLIAWEEEERRGRSLKRRLAAARLGHFKPLADFDWDWPRRCDRMAVEDLMTLDFLNEAATRDPRYCFRLYFAWDDADRQVVIGHLPGHMKT